MDLSLAQSTANCGQVIALPAAAPKEADNRISHSAAVSGTNNIAWAWLGSPTLRYPHRSLGAFSHASRLHLLLRVKNGGLIQLDYELPFHRVFEDLTLRLIDLDGDGTDEVVLVESDAALGAALVVLGVRERDTPQTAGPLMTIKELARSPNVGMRFRWMNPVGAADFDNDGRIDLASIVTPHIGGVLTLYQYQPPHLKIFASLTDVSNHRMGATEQRLAVIVPPSSRESHPTIIVPDMGLKALYAVRWANGQWQEIARVRQLPATAVVLLPYKDGACAQLSDGTWWKASLMH